MNQNLKKQILKVKQLEQQWQTLSSRLDLTSEQRAYRKEIDKKLFCARRVLKQLKEQEADV